MIKKIYVLIFVLFSVIKVSAQTYCTPTVTNTGVTGDYVNNFTFATISNLNSGDNPADYQLYTQTTSVIQGLTYPFTIQSGSTTWNQGLALFIDYNDDGDFADAGELAFATATTGTSAVIASGNITIPLTATPGNIRMRVISKFNAVVASTESCGGFGYGEFEDYEITLVASTPCSAKPTAGTVSANTSPCPGVITNFTLLGSSLLNNLSYQWQRANTCTASVWANLPGAISSTYSVVVPGTRAYRCIVTCLNSGLKDTTAPICITPQTWSPISNCWCIPTYTTASTTQNIENVELGALNNNTAALGNPAPNYVDYTATQLAGTLPIPIVFAGVTNTIKVKGGTGNNQFSGIWIDYNHDGLFGTTEYASTGVTAGAGGTAAINFTPPSTPPNLSTVPNGVTRLRVRGGETSQNTSAQPCGATSSTTGEAEDYLVQILTPVAHDPTVTAISSPAGNCFTNCEPISVTVTNYGTSAINLLINPVKVFLKINNVIIDSQLVTGTTSLNSLAGNSATVTFPCVNLYAGGTYKINTKLSMGNASGNVNGYLITDSLYSPISITNYRPTPGAPFEVCENQGIGFGQGLTVTGCGNLVTDSIEIVFNVTPCIDNVGATGTGTGAAAHCENIYSCDFANAIVPALPVNNPNFLYGEYTVTNYSTTYPTEPRFVLYKNQDPSVLSNIYNPALQGYGVAGNVYTLGVSTTVTGAIRKYTRRVNATTLGQIFNPANIGSPINVGYWESYNDNLNTSDITPNTPAQTEVRMKIYFNYVPSKINWYDDLTSTTILDTLVPFNPIGSTSLSPSVQLSNTSVPGTYTFFATCDGNDCRVPVDLIINPSPLVVQDTISLCEDAPGSNQAIFDLCSVNGPVTGYASSVTVGYYYDPATLSQIQSCNDTTSSVIRYSKVSALGCFSVDTLLLKVNALPNFPGGGSGLPQLFGNACAPSCLDVANLITFATVPAGSDTLYYENAACTVLHPNPHSVCTTDTVWIVLKSPTTPACTDTAVAYIDITPALNLIANQVLPGNFSSSGTVPAVTNPLSDGQYQMYYQTSDCRKVASVQDLPNGISMGSTIVKQEVNSSTLSHNGQPYVNRVYEVIPTVQDSAEVCLLYLDDDIAIYNADAPGFGFNTPMTAANFTITQTHNGNVDSPNHTFTVIPTSAIQSSFDPSTTVWTLCFKVDSFSYFYLHTQNISNAALPINIVRFTGKRIENASVLSWTTLSEQNNAYFEIEHSKDARNFTLVSDKIKTKANNGNGNTVLNYDFVDKLPNEGHNYYRLKQTDKDGKTSMAKNVVDVYFGDETMVTMYPNPASSELNVDINIVKATNAKLKIMDATGRVVKQIDMNLKAGGNQTKVSLEGLSDGMYMVNITNDKGLHYAQTIRKN